MKVDSDVGGRKDGEKIVEEDTGAFDIVFDERNLIRFKIYGKTAERLTSTGVSET